MRFRIDGFQVFTDNDQPPAFTLSVNSIIDPSKINGTASSTIKVISTKEAKRILGSEYMAEVPRNNRPRLRVGDDDVDIYATDVAPVSFDRNVIECIGVGGNASWFNYASDTNISEIDLGESVGPLDYAAIMATYTDEDSLLYFPLASYGYLDDRSNSFNVQRWRLRPALRIHRILEIAMAAQGFEFIPMGRLAERWKKFVVLTPSEVRTNIPFDNPEGALVRPAGSAGYTLTNLGATPNSYPLSLVELDPASHISTSFFQTTEAGGIDVRVEGVGLLIDVFSPPPDGELFYFHVYDFTNGTVLATKTVAYDSAAYLDGVRLFHTFENVTVPTGADIGIAMQRETGGYSGTCSINQDCLVSYSPVDIFYEPGYLLWNQDDFVTYSMDVVSPAIDIKSAAPDMSIADLLIGLANNQNLVMITKEDGRIEVWYEKEYFRKPDPSIEVRDWSDRMDHSVGPKRIREKVPTKILFRWKDDSGDEDLYRATAVSAYPKYANEDYAIPFGFAPEKKIQLPFSATVMGEILGGISAPVMRKKDGTYQVDSFDRQPRLLIADGTRSGTWNAGGASQSVYPFCYFVTNEADGIPIAWGNATAGYAHSVATNWYDRLLRMRTSSILEAYLFLRDNELQEFDHGMPTLVDDGSGPAWYYVQEIVQHRFGGNQPTKCLLVEIPGKDVSLADPVVREPVYPSLPFVCAGPGYVALVFEGDSDMSFETDSGYVSVRAGGVTTTYASGATLPTDISSCCVWSSDAAGNASGAFTFFYAAQITDGSNLAGLAGQTIADFLVEINGMALVLPAISTTTQLVAVAFGSGDTVDASAILSAPTIDIGGPELSGMTLPVLSTLTAFSMSGAAASEALVDYAINSCYASALAGSTFSGGINVAGDSNAAPGAASAAALAALESSSGLTVSDTTLTEADGEYDPDGTNNGRNAYIHAVNGISQIFWTGAVWRILTTAGIYDSSDDVMEPWLVTTWVIISGSGSLPTIAPPGLGITVTHN